MLDEPALMVSTGIPGLCHINHDDYLARLPDTRLASRPSRSYAMPLSNRREFCDAEIRVRIGRKRLKQR